MKKNFIVQLRAICSTWQYVLSCWIMCVIVLGNYIKNVNTYVGMDYLQLHDGVKLLTLSEYSAMGFYLMQIFPIMVILPAGFSMVLDRKAKTSVLLQARMGAGKYFVSKMMAVFTASFLVFTVPLLLEMLLTMIAFPVSVVEDPCNFGIYDADYVYSIKYLNPMPELYIWNRWLYMAMYIAFFGITAGILNIFAAAVSTCVKRFQVLIFLPVYLLLQGLYYVDKVIPEIGISGNYFYYLRAFCRKHISLPAMFCVLGLLLIASILLCYREYRKGCLL